MLEKRLGCKGKNSLARNELMLLLISLFFICLFIVVYFINISKLDWRECKWGKAVRKSETDVIKVFVEYAKNQGSQNADRYYTILSKLVNSKLGILSGQRDNISQQTLMEIKTLEGLISMRLNKLMKNKTNYKDVYKDIKNLIESILISCKFFKNIWRVF